MAAAVAAAEAIKNKINLLKMADIAGGGENNQIAGGERELAVEVHVVEPTKNYLHDSKICLLSAEVKLMLMFHDDDGAIVNRLALPPLSSSLLLPFRHES